MSRPTPRRPASSRGTTPRPRKIAGQSDVVRADPDEQSLEASVEVETPAPKARKSAAGKKAGKPAENPAEKPTEKSTEKSAQKAAVPSAAPSAEADDRPGILARPKTTRVLIATLALVALASLAQFAILLVDQLNDDDKDKAPVSGGQMSVPEGRPVVADALPVLEGVEQAAKAAQEIVAIDFASYDAEVEKAAELMTSQFEKQYRTTAEDIEEEFVANKTRVEANVVAQGVVRANRTRLEALVFLNQVVSRERDGEPETVVTPYKVLVTMVHTDQGWLVDRLDTDLPQDKNN